MILHDLENGLASSADETVKATDVTGKAVEEIERTKDQLQNLGRSINIIIRDSVAAVKEGKLVTDSTAAEFENVVGIRNPYMVTGCR